MKKITNFIVKHSYAILAIILILTGFCGFLAMHVNINHDISKYMPSDSETSLGLELMETEFNGEETSSYLLMFDDLTDEEKISVQEFIENVDGVKEVAHDQTENYEKDNHALYEITVEGSADGETAASVYNTINDEYSGKYKMTGKGDVYSNNATVLSIWIILLAVGCAMLILIIMSSSYVEPFLFLTAIMIGVVLNYGTNIIFENVSHITSAIAAILQMALSMDYAIMLASRYRQEREHEQDKHKAMQKALSKAFGSITASSITTVVGLFVLVFMSFTIGRDMGLVLSKGVVLSLISIFTCLPAFLLLFDKLIQKTKKRAFNIKLDALGKFSFKVRHLAPFVFLAILGTSFLLKGNVGILYTDSEMDKIKDIFPENNQIAVIYDNEMESRVAGYCKDYEERNDAEITRVLCYSNTINEPETVTELTEKFSDLGTEIDVKDYLLKLIYYHYYNPDESHTMTVTDFVNFLQNDIFSNGDFSDQVTPEMRTQIKRLANFTTPAEITKNRSLADLANILEIDQSKLYDLMIYYGSKSDNGVSLTLPQFVSFMQNEVLTDPTYSQNVDAATRAQLNQLATFTNKTFINSQKSATELASAFGLSESQVQSLLQYYLYLNITDSTTKLSVPELVNFATTNPTVSSQLTEEQKQLFAKLVQLDDTGNKYTYAELPEAIKTLVTTKVATAQTLVTTLCQNFADYGLEANCQAYIYLDDATGLPETITATINDTLASYGTSAAEIRTLLAGAASLDNLDAVALSAQLKQIYVLYDIAQALPSTTLSPVEFVNFLLAHRSDEMLSGQISSSAVSSLQLAQFVMTATNKNTTFTSASLASHLSIDQSSLRLLYSLYSIKHVNPNPTISLKTLVNFMINDVATSADYGSQISATQLTDLKNIQAVMNAALSATQLNKTELYNLLAPLSSDLKQTLIDVLYIYHGSLTDYNDEWTMTVEQFVNYLNDTILTDERFADLIPEDIRTKVTDAKTTIQDAKDLLVGENYSRAILNTHYGAEGEETFTFIQRLKDTFGEDSTAKVYVIGNSPMAYEMSQTFNDEMNFITILTMAAIFIVVAVTFRSVIIPVILVLLIQTAVWITMSILSLTGSSVYFIAMIIVQSILMGATIDYAILYTSYYLESRQTMAVKESIMNAYNKSIHTILTSASILIIVTAIVGNFASAIAAKICTTISQGTLCSAILILLLLPPLLAVVDRIIVRKKGEKKAKPGKKSHKTAKA